MTALVILSLIGLAFTAYVLFPLFRDSKMDQFVHLGHDSTLEQLIYRKLSIYNNIKDLDFEFQMGKISEADYRLLRANLKKEVAPVLAEIDAFNLSDDTLASVESEIKASQQQLENKNTVLCPACDFANLEDAQFCQHCGHSLETLACPSCNQPYVYGQRFCNHCGHQLEDVKAPS